MMRYPKFPRHKEEERAANTAPMETTPTINSV